MEMFEGSKYIPVFQLAQTLIRGPYRRNLHENDVTVSLLIGEDLWAKKPEVPCIKVWFKNYSWHKKHKDHLVVSAGADGRIQSHTFKVQKKVLGSIYIGLLRLEQVLLSANQPCCPDYQKILHDDFDFSAKFCRWCGSYKPINSIDKQKEPEINRFEQILNRR